MINFSLKRAVAVAILGGASVGAHATVTNLGPISSSVPTTFTGTVLGNQQTFMDIFTFTLEQPNAGSGYNVVDFPVNIPGVGSLGTIFSSIALITYGVDGIRGTTDDKVLGSVDSTSPSYSQGHLSLSWDQPITGPAYLTVGGVTSGSLGGLYSGSISSVSPVPEPESYAMLLAGLGLMGAVVRRRGMRK